MWAALSGLSIGGGLCLFLSTRTASTGPGVGKRLVAHPLGQRLTNRRASDLALCRTMPEAYAGRLLAGVVLGVGVPVAVLVVARLAGVSLPPPLGIAMVLMTSPGLMLRPVVALRADASRRRRAFRHSFSGFCDLVALSVAAGHGIDTALAHAADRGRNDAAGDLRTAIADARVHGEPSWWGLHRLADTQHLPEVSEFAAVLSLAANGSGRLEDTLAAKAATLRHRARADMRAAASSATEQMAMPLTLLLVAYVALVAFPALDRILHL